ncbi:MAG: hypothetical protein M0P64_01145 [Candidatus Pacebacteria bacterium]|jgi:hypothetical protein|nr:hypothetical protein [Candidatus Paceibacterota bacterium]
MNPLAWQFKKIFSVLFAILVGLGIIFFAWKSTVALPAENTPESEGGEWRDSLSVVPQASSTKTLGAATRGAEATTTTGIIARELMTNYLVAQDGTPSTMSDEDAELFAQKVLDKGTPSSSIKEYTQKDFVVVGASTSTVSLYQKEISQAMNTLMKENSFNELLVVSKAIETGDPSGLKSLDGAISSYQKLLRSLLSIKVPQTSIALHVYVTQSYATILSGVIDMQKIISDPVIGLQGIAKYNKGVDMLSQSKTPSSTIK